MRKLGRIELVKERNEWIPEIEASPMERFCFGDSRYEEAEELEEYDVEEKEQDHHGHCCCCKRHK